MVENSKKVATFHSAFKNGDIELWYYPWCDVYELCYDVQFYTPDGLGEASASCSYDTVDYILGDAIELANTPLLERD